MTIMRTSSNRLTKSFGDVQSVQKQMRYVQSKCAKIMRDVQSKCAKIMRDVQLKCAKIIRDVQLKCAKIIKADVRHSHFF